jgi:outer membrane scaffolding protein for murein synthesis (MipA/OmpV family)
MKKYLGIVLLSATCLAHGQTLDFAQLTPTQYIQNNVNFSLGAAVISMPKYMGSDERRIAAYPAFDAQWKNGVFFSALSGFGYNFSKNPSLQYGLRLTVEGGRDESRSSKLAGLGDVDSTIEPGAFFNYSLNSNYALLSSVRYGSGVDHNGLQVSIGGRAAHSLNADHRLSALFSANWANSQYAQSYFGVNAAQSNASGYNQFTPGAGMTDIKLGANWNWSIDTNWSLTTGASVKHLLGDSANSPFVIQKTPVTIFSAASYRF